MKNSYCVSGPSSQDDPRTMRRFVAGSWLRCGYTTGVCAAGAAKAAATMMLGGPDVSAVCVTTPGGHELALDVSDITRGPGWASCAVRKDGGDDPDATDGALIFARVESTPTEQIELTHPEQIAASSTEQIASASPEQIIIDGGEGIGRVTKPGLDQPVGAAAINRVPRQMIEQGIREAWALRAPQSTPGCTVTVSCPTGEAIATKTFNPKLGIVGGISILGTTGIVEPMSNAALVETTAREISILAASGVKDLVIVVGNYGQSFASTVLGLNLTNPPSSSPTTAPPSPPTTAPSPTPPPASPPQWGWVKSSNFIGDAIESAALAGCTTALVIGHLGKMSKLGIGMLNTHSSVGDGRIETLIACALEAGADLDLAHTLLACVSTDAAVAALIDADLLDATMDALGRRIQATFERRSPTDIHVEWICFTGVNDHFTTVAHSPDALAWATTAKTTMEGTQS